MAFWPSFGHEGTTGEFEWLDGVYGSENFQLLKEGYLNMSTSVEEEEEGETGHRRTSSENGTGNAAAKSLRRSNGSFIKGWKRRWCVLSQSSDGSTNLLYYKQQSSYANCEAPCGVLLMGDCNKLYTMPSHHKSKNTFAVNFPYKTVLFYTDKDSELENWLEAFQRSLRLKGHGSTPQDPTGPSAEQLKGLPKQKAMRRDFSRNSSTDLEMEAEEPTRTRSSPTSSTSGSYKEVPTFEEIDTQSAAKKVKVLSYKVLS